MISIITGTLLDKDNNIAIVDCGGVGLETNISDTTMFELGNVGESVTIYTYMQVREDAITLFGFATKEEKSVFLKLINVSGIGCKTAIGILSAIPSANLVEAITSENIRALSTVKGIGKKTAERMVLELKNSFDDISLSLKSAKIMPTFNLAIEEAIDVLVSMGLTRFDATNKVKNVAKEGDKTEDIIRKSLQILK